MQNVNPCDEQDEREAAGVAFVAVTDPRKHIAGLMSPRDWRVLMSELAQVFGPRARARIESHVAALERHIEVIQSHQRGG